MRAATAAGIRASQLQARGKASQTASLAATRHWQHHNQRTSISASQYLHTLVVGPLDDRRRREQKDERDQHQLSSLAGSHQFARYHGTPVGEKAVAIVLGLASLSALSYAGSSAVKAYQEYKASLPTPEEMEEMRKQQEKDNAENADQQQQEAQANTKSSDGTAGGERENVFAKWFGVGVGAKYYEGGFEETMTRREAALILGVRESSPASRIKLAHRKLLVLNHPGTYY